MGTASNAVVIYTAANGAQTTLTTSQYSLTINPIAPGQIWGVGGTVTTLSATPIPSGSTLTIDRVVPLTQLATLSDQGDFYAQVVEAALDTLCMEIQQVSAQTTRSIQIPVVDQNVNVTLPAAAARANQYLAFDSSGNVTTAIGNTPLPGSSTEHALARFSDDNGNLQSTGIIADDANNLSAINNLSVSGNAIVIENISVGGTLDVAGSSQAGTLVSTGGIFGVAANISGMIGVGGNSVSSNGITVQNTTLSGVNQRGVSAQPVFTSGATSSGVGLFSKPSTVDASFTQVTMAGAYLADATRGAASTITTQYGVFIENMTAGSTNWQVYSAGNTPSYYAGEIRSGTTLNLSLGSTTTNGVNYRPSGVIDISVNSASAVNIQRTGSDGDVQNFYRGTTLSGGISVTSGATSFNTSSDKRLKENVEAIADSEDIFDRIEPVYYNFKNQPSGARLAGFIAQDLYDVVPQAVTPGDLYFAELGSDNFRQWQVDLSKIVPHLVAEVKSMRSRLKALEDTHV